MYLSVLPCLLNSLSHSLSFQCLRKSCCRRTSELNCRPEVMFSASVLTVHSPQSSMKASAICRRDECGRVMGATGAKIRGYQWWIHCRGSLASATASLWPVRNHSSGRTLKVRVELLHLSGRVCVHLYGPIRSMGQRAPNGTDVFPSSKPAKWLVAGYLTTRMR